MNRALCVLSLCALLGAAPASAPAGPNTTGLHYPAASLTDIGGTKLLSENDGDAAVSGVQIFVAAGLDREGPKSGGAAALVAETIVRSPLNGVPLRDAIEANGGLLTYTVDGRSVHYYLEGRSGHLDTLVGMFAKVLAAPDFSAATVASARTSLAPRQTESESNALSVGIQMFRRTYYAAGAGGPALGDVATSALLSTKDLAAFYAENYKRDAVMASVVGASTPALAASISALVAALPGGSVASVAERARAIPPLPPHIVAHREIPAPWVVVGYAAAAPSSRDFGAMLVLEALLSEAFERSSTTSLGFAEKPVGAVYLYDSSPASMIVYVNGSQVDPSLAVRQLLLVAHSLSTKPLGEATLRRFKAAAEGTFISDSADLSDRSYLLGTFASQGLGADSINAALGALERTTASDVQRAAKTYLQRYIVALVLPRAAGEAQ